MAGHAPRPSYVTQTLYALHTEALSLKCLSLTYSFSNHLMSSSSAVIIEITWIFYSWDEITCSPVVKVR